MIATLQRANHGSQFRAYGLRGAAELIDPFLRVDHAKMSGPTFSPHPHAGFCAVSYVFLDSEAGMDNRDSQGTHNLIRPGRLHWAVAGRGIVHEENPAEGGRSNPIVRAPHRPPEVGPTAFTTHLPDLPPRHMMVMGFTIACSLVPPGSPHIGFLFVRS